MDRSRKIYLSRKFYEGQAFSLLEPSIELTALEYLKESLLNREEYDKIAIVQKRINELRKILTNTKTTKPCRYILKEIRYSLN